MKRTLGLILALTLAGAFAAASQAAQKGSTMMLVATPTLRRFGALLACMAWAALGAPMAQASVAAPRRSDNSGRSRRLGLRRRPRGRGRRARGRCRPYCGQSAAPDRRVGAPRRLQIANNKEDKVKRLLILAATLAAALSVGVATSGAAPETPNGYCGAANMLNAWPGGGANVPNGGGMQNAMTVNNANGNNGMFGAVGATAC